MSAAEDFWDIWSERFPVSATHTDGTDALPEGVEFSRAGQTVFVSLEELWVLTYGRGFKNPEPDIVPGSEEDLIRREAEPQHGQTGYATGNGMGHG